MHGISNPQGHIFTLNLSHIIHGFLLVGNIDQHDIYIYICVYIYMFIWQTIHGYGSYMISVYGEKYHSSWWINVCLSGSTKKYWAVSPTYAHKLALDTQTNSELPTASPQGRMVSGWSGQSCTSNLDQWVDKPFRNFIVNIDIMHMHKTHVPDNVEAFRQGTTFGRLHHSAPKWTAYKGSTPACSPKVVQPGFAEIQPSSIPRAPHKHESGEPCAI